MLLSRRIEHYVCLLGLLLLCWASGDVAGMLEPSAAVLHALVSFSSDRPEEDTDHANAHVEE